MAAPNDPWLEQIIDEFVLQKGCNREEVLNEIEAWRIDKKPQRELKASLNRLKKNTKAFTLEKPQVNDLFNPILVKSDSNTTNLDEEKVDHSVAIEIQSIPHPEKYFMEDQELIDFALKQQKDFIKFQYLKNYEITESNGLIDENQEVWIVGRIELRDDNDEEY